MPSGSAPKHDGQQGPSPHAHEQAGTAGGEAHAYGQTPYGQPPYAQPPPAYGQPPYGQGAPRDPEPRPYGHGGLGAGDTAQPRASAASPATSTYDVADIYPTPSKGGRRGIMVASVVTAVVLVAGGAAWAYTAFLRGDSNPGGQPIAVSSTSGPTESPAATRTSASPSAAPSFDPRSIRTIERDSKPLRLSEEFPEKNVTVGGVRLHRVATDVTEKCPKAAQRGFGKVLRKADCRRVLRATFVDTDTKYAVTAGVAVLPTWTDAKRVEKAANARKNVWFAALPGPRRSGAHQIHRSGGYSAVEVIGHYVVFSFAAYADRITPPPKAPDLLQLCARMRDYAAQPIVARGMVTPSPAAG